MDQKTLQLRILKELVAQGDEVGPPGELEADFLAQRIGADVQDVEHAIRILTMRGLLEEQRGGFVTATLTGKGYELAQEESGTANQPQNVQMTFHGPVAGSAIAVGGSHASVNYSGLPQAPKKQASHRVPLWGFGSWLRQPSTWFLKLTDFFRSRALWEKVAAGLLVALIIGLAAWLRGMFNTP